jgi:hypothetical protein
VDAGGSGGGVRPYAEATAWHAHAGNGDAGSGGERRAPAWTAPAAPAPAVIGDLQPAATGLLSEGSGSDGASGAQGHGSETGALAAGGHVGGLAVGAGLMGPSEATGFGAFLDGILSSDDGAGMPVHGTVDSITGDAGKHGSGSVMRADVEAATLGVSGGIGNSFDIGNGGRGSEIRPSAMGSQPHPSLHGLAAARSMSLEPGRGTTSAVSQLPAKARTENFTE